MNPFFLFDSLMSSWRWPFLGGIFFWDHLEISHSMRVFLSTKVLSPYVVTSLAALLQEAQPPRWLLGGQIPWHNGCFVPFLRVETPALYRPPRTKGFLGYENAWVFDMNHPHSKKNPKSDDETTSKQRGWRMMAHLSASWLLFSFWEGRKPLEEMEKKVRGFPWLWFFLRLHRNFNPYLGRAEVTIGNQVVYLIADEAKLKTVAQLAASGEHWFVHPAWFSPI